jgi:hypothetical protein
MCTSFLISIPSPPFYERFGECAIKELDNVFSDAREEFPPVKGASCCDIEVFTTWVRGDYKILIWGYTIPNFLLRIEPSKGIGGEHTSKF